jgi:transposase
MKYIDEEVRNQVQLYTWTLNELIGGENPVRVIDAFVDSLNLEELGIQHATPAQT